MSRGFRCWMEAWSQLLTKECSRAQQFDPPESSALSGMRRDVVILLAGMLLQSFEGDRMRADAHQKVTPSHLKRTAYLYVRQSSLRQVFENTESTKRQYALRQHAIALGWQPDQIIVIDSDLGQSGASAADREGFQRLVTEVSLGRAGIVLGLEVSRLARTRWTGIDCLRSALFPTR
jgi:Resolvase, N terminal domain